MTSKLRIYCNFDEAKALATPNCTAEAKQRPALRHKVILSTAEEQADNCSLVIGKFCTKYNSQESVSDEQRLDPARLQLKLGDTVIKSAFAPITSYISDYNDVDVVFAPPGVAEAAAQHEPGSVPCTNFGCGKRFVPGRDDTEGSCNHHAGRPVFHDTYKYWSCCPSTRTMEFDEFEKIPPCAVGVHKHEPVVTSVAVSGGGASAGQQEVDRKPLTPEEIAEVQRQQAGGGGGGGGGAGGGAAAASAADLPEAVRGPREFTGAAQRPPQQLAADGTYRCRRYGCQQRFKPEDNHDTACTYHCKGPVFHDTYKFWACCPDRKHDDFADFEKVPGCTVGRHEQ